MHTTIKFHGRTDVGKVRNNNEDDFIAQTIWDEDHLLVAAIDGVGGYDGGEVATAIAKQTIVDYLSSYPNGERLALLKQAVINANNRIYEERTLQPEFANMSCVLTVCLIEIARMRLHMVHVGDTRFYKYTNQTLTKLSHDHSLVGYREEVGELTEEEAMAHPQRNIIGRDVGSDLHKIDDEDFIEAVSVAFTPNTQYLLCTDGLTDMLTTRNIMNILETNKPVTEKTEKLIEAANAKGGRDNTTVVLVEFQGKKQTETPAEEKGGTIAPVSDEDYKEEHCKENPKAEQPMSAKKQNKIFVLILIVIACLLIGFCGGWFLHSYYYAVARKNATPDNRIETTEFRSSEGMLTKPNISGGSEPQSNTQDAEGAVVEETPVAAPSPEQEPTAGNLIE